MQRVESVEYRGITFRRYPDSKRSSDRSYFRPNSGHIRAGVEALHREIYRDHYGPIPDGWHVHHKDGNPANNDPDNLECLPCTEHVEHHASQRRGKPSPNPEHLERAREAAKAWHASPEGLAWHSENGRRAWESRTAQTLDCEECGKKYDTLHRGNTRFCSNACKSKWRRKAGLDDVDKTCCICHTTFRASKYEKNPTCSRHCGQALRRARTRVQPVGQGDAGILR